MKIKLYLLLLTLIPSICLAQALPIRNDNNANLRDLGSDLQVGRNFSVDQAGRTKVVLSAGVASATNPIKLEDSAATSGDAGIAALGVINDTYATLGASGDYTWLATGRAGNQLGTIVYDDVLALSRQVSKPEDAAAASGDPGVFALAIRNTVGTTFAGTDGDYSGIAVNQFGVLNASPFLYNLGSTDLAQGILKAEDGAAASGEAGVAQLHKRLDQLATGETGSNNEYAVPLVDTLSRQYVNAWGSAVTEFIQGCNGAVSTATTGTMLAAEASQRYYISSWQCTNTGAAATRVILEDGAGTDLANVMLAATTGFASVQFPVPVRASAANSAAQINVITTGTSTICCFNGFKSVY